MDKGLLRDRLEDVGDFPGTGAEAACVCVFLCLQACCVHVVHVYGCGCVRVLVWQYKHMWNVGTSVYTHMHAYVPGHTRAI